MCTCVSMGINYQSCLARTTNFSNSSWLQFPTLFSNTVKKYFWVFWRLLYTYRANCLCSDDIATRWEGLSHCLAHYTIHFQPIVNANSNFYLVGGWGVLILNSLPDFGVTHLFIYRSNEPKWTVV